MPDLRWNRARDLVLVEPSVQKKTTRRALCVMPSDQLALVNRTRQWPRQPRPHLSGGAQQSSQNVARQLVARIQRAQGHGKTVASAAGAFCWPRIGESKRELPTVRKKTQCGLRQPQQLTAGMAVTPCVAGRRGWRQGDSMARGWSLRMVAERACILSRRVRRSRRR